MCLSTQTHSFHTDRPAALKHKSGLWAFFSTWILFSSSILSKVSSLVLLSSYLHLVCLDAASKRSLCCHMKCQLNLYIIGENVLGTFFFTPLRAMFLNIFSSDFNLLCCPYICLAGYQGKKNKNLILTEMCQYHFFIEHIFPDLN